MFEMYLLVQVYKYDLIENSQNSIRRNVMNFIGNWTTLEGAEEARQAQQWPECYRIIKAS